MYNIADLMTTQNKIDLSEKNISSIHAWIRALDAKIGIFLAFQGIILTLIIPTYLSSFTANIARMSNEKISIIFLAAGFILFGILSALFGIYPILKLKGYHKSLLFFGAIASYSLGDYKQKIKELTDDEYLNQVVEQVHITSKIANIKHNRLMAAIIYFLIGFFLLIFSYIWISLL